jgi:hypothetical protein
MQHAELAELLMPSPGNKFRSAAPGAARAQARCEQL